MRSPEPSEKCGGLCPYCECRVLAGRTPGRDEKALIIEELHVRHAAMCKKDPAPRAFNKSHTRKFSRVHVAQDDCVVLQSCLS